MVELCSLVYFLMVDPVDFAKKYNLIIIYYYHFANNLLLNWLAASQNFKNVRINSQYSHSRQ